MISRIISRSSNFQSYRKEQEPDSKAATSRVVKLPWSHNSLNVIVYVRTFYIPLKFF